MIVVTGASGFIGSNLVKKLAKRGQQVTCFVRKTSDTSYLNSLPVKIVEGDIQDVSSLKKILEKGDTLVHLAAVTSETSPDYSTSRKINVEGTRRLLDLSKEKGVKRFITLSSESTKRKIKGAYAQTKAEADQLIRDSGVPYTILRPSIVYGAGSGGLFQKTLSYIETLPIIPIVGSGKQEIIPIHVDDVTDAIIATLDKENTLNKEYDLTGATTLTFNQFFTEIMNECGIKKRKLNIPFFAIYAAAKMMALVMKNPPVTTDNLLGLKQEVSMSYKQAKNDFNFKPLTFKQGLKRTFYPPPSQENKQIGIVGVGKMGLLHASLINQIKGAEVVALMDKNPKMKNQLRTIGFSAPFFTNIERMMNNVHLDGVFICTPPFLNHVLAKSFIDKKIGIFVEKPLSTTLKDAECMVKQANENKVITSCGFMVAYHPIFEKLGKFIKEKKFGDVSSFECFCYVSQVFTQKKPKSTWQYDPLKTGGGVLITMCSHVIFLLNTYFGNSLSVNGKMMSKHTLMDDEFLATLTFPKNVSGTLKTSWSVKGYDELTIGIKVETEKASIEATNKLITIAHKGGKKEEIHISQLDDESSFELGGKGYYEQDEAFIHSLSSRKQPLTSWESSLHVQRTIEALYRSAKTHKEERV